MSTVIDVDHELFIAARNHERTQIHSLLDSLEAPEGPDVETRIRLLAESCERWRKMATELFVGKLHEESGR